MRRMVGNGNIFKTNKNYSILNIFFMQKLILHFGDQITWQGGARRGKEIDQLGCPSGMPRWVNQNKERGA